jgi:hypothetical protein
VPPASYRDMRPARRYHLPVRAHMAGSYYYGNTIKFHTVLIAKSVLGGFLAASLRTIILLLYPSTSSVVFAPHQEMGQRTGTYSILILGGILNASTSFGPSTETDDH